MKVGDLVICHNWTNHPQSLGMIVETIQSETYEQAFRVLVDTVTPLFFAGDIKNYDSAGK